LAKAIGLTPEAVALGYGYITEGDTPDIEASQFIRVGS
jgi:mannose-1-phosphate guanylyltransferase